MTTPFATSLMLSPLKSWLAKAATRKVSSAMAQETADHRFHVALSETRDEIIWDMRAIVIALAKALTGLSMSGDQATEFLLKFARDPKTHRNFLALWSLAERSSDRERAAMLCTVFIAGAETPMRERIYWSIGNLFPDDVRLLSVIIKASQSHGFTSVLAALEKGSHAPLTWEICAMFEDEQHLVLIKHASPQCLRALDGARCIELASGIGLSEGVVMHSLKILEIGYALHEIESTIDWSAVASERSSKRTSGTAT
jgi:hypothetical protein